MKKLLICLTLISPLLFSQQIGINKVELKIFDSDTLLIFNTGESDLLLDTLYSVNPTIGYFVKIELKDTVLEYYSISQVIDPTPLQVFLAKNDTAKFVFGYVDLCVICKSKSGKEYFNDTLVLISNSINNDSLLLYVEGNGFLSDSEDEEILNNFYLAQNFPNPFNPETKIKYSVAIRGFVTLKVFDMLGKEIVTLVNEEKPAGNYEVEFDGETLSSGIYFYRISTEKFTKTKKMMLIR